VDALNIRLRRGLLAALLAMAAGAADSQQQATEAAVKAAFLYKFPGYVEWPAQALGAADAPFVIGVAGSEEVAAELERLVPNRPIANRKVVVRRVKEGESPRGLNMLFVGRNEGASRALVRAAQQQPGVLVVTESDRGLEMGAAINLVSLEERIAFEVSLENAERAGLHISSRMLAVARRVVPRG
jgi:uncharacterized protein DUF4154